MISFFAYWNSSLRDKVQLQVFTVGLTRSLKFVMVSEIKYNHATCSIRLNQDLAALSVFWLWKVCNVPEDILTWLHPICSHPEACKFHLHVAKLDLLFIESYAVVSTKLQIIPCVPEIGGNVIIIEQGVIHNLVLPLHCPGDVICPPCVGIIL